VPEVGADADHGMYELVEYQERQAKFVVSGQRVYEFYGYDWRLPLWDNAYCDFFERMPLSAKINQSLFREVLEEANWGGVWRPLLPRKYETPAWAGHLRRAAKAALFALPADKWDAVDRRVFAYLLDGLCVNSQQPYARFLLDRRGARHGVAFRCEAYLAEHGLGRITQGSRAQS
jgi:asparagine synthase (glutamine-hydrolysing)